MEHRPASPRRSPAQDVVDAMLSPVKFFVRKKSVRPMLHALTGTQPNPYQPHGSPGMQDRTDLSGKFASRLAGIRRALTRADEDVIEERRALTLRHAERFPEFESDGVTPHPQAGKPTPVYAMAADGVTPLFKKDKAGNDTEERQVMHDQYNLVDPDAFEREFKSLLNEFTVVDCIGFTQDDFNAFKSSPQQNSPLGKIIDMLSDLVRDGETEATPEEQAKALEDRAASYIAEAKRIREEDAAAGTAVIDPPSSAEPARDGDAEAPTAP